MTVNQRLNQFVQSSQRYVKRMAKKADADRNGTIENHEKGALKDLEDTFDLYPANDVDGFIKYYSNDVAVSALRAGSPDKLPRDLADNYKNWLSYQPPVYAPVPTELSKSQAHHLGQFIMHLLIEEFGYYDADAADEIHADRYAIDEALINAFEANQLTLSKVDTPDDFAPDGTVNTVRIHTGYVDNDIVDDDGSIYYAFMDRKANIIGFGYGHGDGEPFENMVHVDDI